jgi:diadenylate cyclase
MFQPELRTVLEKIGRTNLRNINIFNTQKGAVENRVTYVIDQVCECCKDLSARRIGGLMVFERSTKLGDIINTGISVDSDVTSQMLGTIFFPNTPLHDGAVVIRDYRIAAAGCLLPLSQRMEISSSLGTRHRAAVGVSEISDALTVVISEETGRISYTYNSEIFIGVTVEELRSVMTEILTPEKQKSLFAGREDKK